MVKIGGLEKSSLIDYPGKVSAVVFTYGCSLRCPYCHNPELVIERFNKDIQIRQKYFFDFLKKRVGKLDGVVITGGEPLIYDDLDVFICKIKKLGFLVKLDTNGMHPDKLKYIIDKGLVDYIAMDVKYSESSYIKLAGGKIAYRKISKSIQIIMNSGIEYEFRTTYVKGIHDLDSVEQIASLIKDSRVYYIQNFREGKSIDPTLSSENSFSPTELKKIKKIAKKYIKNVIIR